MLIVLGGILLLPYSFMLCAFGFIVGRCARRLPVIDNHLPWTMHRGQESTSTHDTWTRMRC